MEEFSLSDLYYEAKWAGKEQPEKSQQITLVDITPMHSRAKIAELLERIDSCGPAVVGVDVIFEDFGFDPLADSILQTTVPKLKNAVFAYKLTDYKEEEHTFKSTVHSFFTDKTAVDTGYVNTVGGLYTTCLRYLSVNRNLQGKSVKSFTAAVAEKDMPGCLPANDANKYFINYAHKDFPVVSCDSVPFNAKLIKNRIVLIGTLNSEEDMHVTPIGKIPGLKVQAYSVQTLIDHHQTTEVNCVWHFFIIAICTYLTALWQFEWNSFLKKKKHPLLYFFSESKLALRVLTFLWIALLAWGSYILYDKGGYYFNYAKTLAFIILVGEARSLYTAVLKTLSKYTRCASFINKNSIYI